MALAVEWLPEEWPVGIPNLKQLLVVAPLTTSILLLFGCRNHNLRTVWPILGRVPTPPSAKPASLAFVGAAAPLRPLFGRRRWSDPSNRLHWHCSMVVLSA